MNKTIEHLRKILALLTVGLYPLLHNVNGEHSVSKALRPTKDFNVTRHKFPTLEESLVSSFKLILQEASGPGKSAYIGCFTPLTSDRKWNHQENNATAPLLTMDIRGCVGHCWTGRYRFSFIKGEDCHCSNIVGGLHKSQTHRCNRPCYGNQRIFCGGGNGSFYDVYYTGYVKEPEFDSVAYEDIPKVHVGCYRDRTNALCPFSFSSPRLSVSMCLALCEADIFQYAVIESPRKCCCTQKLMKSTKLYDRHCPLLCENRRGDREKCGAGKINKSVYVTGVPVISRGFKPKSPKFPWMKPVIDVKNLHKVG